MDGCVVQFLLDIKIPNNSKVIPLRRLSGTYRLREESRKG